MASYGDDEQRSNAPAMTRQNCASYFLNVPKPHRPALFYKDDPCLTCLKI
jgi:hypothetical protein